MISFKWNTFAVTAESRVTRCVRGRISGKLVSEVLLVRPLPTKSFITVAACLIVLVANASCSRRRDSNLLSQKCHDLIILDPQAETPVRISQLETSCPTPYSVELTFRVVSNSTRPIKRYEVRAITIYDGTQDSASSVSTTRPEPDGSASTKDQMSSDMIGVTLKHMWSDPRAKLTLSVWSVTFADGSTWNHSPADVSNGQPRRSWAHGA